MMMMRMIMMRIMTQIRLSKLKLKNGGEKIWRAWCEKIKEREDEALLTLVKESVTIEACFIDEEYIYILMIARDMKQADSSVKEEPYPIDIDHRKNMNNSIEIPDKNPDLELLFLLETSK